MLITIIAFIVILSILVLIHELGHFLVAKKFGIKVEEFGFGFPPRVWGIRRGETLYSINALPIGGFVKLFGEDEAPLRSGSPRGLRPRSRNFASEGQAGAGDLKRAYFARSPWQRATIVLAGVVMNFVLAVVIISYLFAAVGVALPTKHVRITEVLKNTPAEKVGFKKGDSIISIAGREITELKSVTEETKKHLGEEISVTIERGGESLTLTIIPRKEPPKEEGPMGIGISNVEVKKYKWYEAPFFGTWEALKFSYLILEGFGKLISDLVFRGIKPEGITGPVGVAQLTGQAVSYGMAATLWFVSLLSLNLAVLNVLPIPALDGGRLFFIIIEIVTRKKVSPRYEAIAHAAGMAILLALMLLITINDVLRVLSGKSLIPQP